MSLNSSVPDSLLPSKPSSVKPNYVGLLQFLVAPFLEEPSSLKIDCEEFPSRARILIRLAFEDSDKGRVFGRGGRNIQAIRSVLEAVAATAGQSAYLEIYGSQPQGREGREGREGRDSSGTDREGPPERSAPRRAPVSKPSPKPRPH